MYTCVHLRCHSCEKILPPHLHNNMFAFRSQGGWGGGGARLYHCIRHDVRIVATWNAMVTTQSKQEHRFLSTTGGTAISKFIAKQFNSPPLHNNCTEDVSMHEINLRIWLVYIHILAALFLCFTRLSHFWFEVALVGPGTIVCRGGLDTCKASQS